MILTVTKPTLLPIGGAEWPVLYNLWALRCIEERYSPVGDWMQSGLEGFIQAQAKLAAGDIDALAAFVWAGLLHDSPALTFDDALALLDEASPAELVRLPELVRKAVLDACGHPSDRPGRKGEPWSWPVALAVWVSEWGQPREDFWRATLREFGAISDGLAHLYRRDKPAGHVEPDPEGWDLFELANMQRRR